MAGTRITINGQHYDSVDAMPPDVRRTYEEALRAMGSLANGQAGGDTQVLTGKAGDVGASLVVNRTVVVNHQTYGGLDKLPPDVRQQFESAMKGGGASVRPKTSVHLSLNVGQHPQIPYLDANTPKPPISIESSRLDAKIRDIPVKVAMWVAIGLILWALLGRH